MAWQFRLYDSVGRHHNVEEAMAIVIIQIDRVCHLLSIFSRTSIENERYVRFFSCSATSQFTCHTAHSSFFSVRHMQQMGDRNYRIRRRKTALHMYRRCSTDSPEHLFLVESYEINSKINESLQLGEIMGIEYVVAIKCFVCCEVRLSFSGLRVVVCLFVSSF